MGKLRSLCRPVSGLLSAILAFSAAHAGAAESYQVLTKGRELAPGESIGVRFTSRMVANPIDADPAEPPLELEPAVPFFFEWLSSQAGRIVLTQAPPLSATLSILPKKGLRNLAGEPVSTPGSEACVRATPAYGIFSTKNADSVRSSAVAANPIVTLAFNFEPSLESLRREVVFLSDRGDAIRAQVELFAGADQFKMRPLTWAESFSPVYFGKTETVKEGRNRFTFRPLQGLAPNRDWRVRFGTGVEDAQDRNRRPFPAPYIHPVGRVEELLVRSAGYEHQVLGEQVVRVEFNKPLASSGEVSKVRLQGAEVKWALLEEGRILEGTTRAKPGTALKLALPAGLLCADGTSLSKPFVQDIEVEGHPRRLYFDNFLTRQFSEGVRKLPVFGVNVDSVTVRVQRVPASEVALAMREWNTYRVFEDEKHPERRENLYSDEFTHMKQRNRRINLALGDSSTVCEKTVALLPVGAPGENEAVLSWDELLGAKESGMFLVTAEAQPEPRTGKVVGAQTLVQLTDIGLVSWMHESGQGATFHAYSLATGKPLAGVQCVFFNQKYEQVGRGETDASGLVGMPVAAVRWMAASRGRDLTTLSLDSWNDDLGPDGDPDIESPSTPTRAFAFLDRDIYRPGETLHAKVFFRQVSKGVLTVPQPFEFSARVMDSEGREVFQTRAISGKGGSWSVEIPLPEQVGSYVLELSKGSESFAALEELRFTVATFQEDKFQLNVQTDAEIAAGSTFEVKINAAYLSGQALNGARGVWTLRCAPEPFNPKGFEGFNFNLGSQSEFSDGIFKEAVSLHSVADQGQLTLDAKGLGGLSRDLRGGRTFTSPMSLEFGLEVTDASQQTLYRGARALLHSSDFYLGVQESRRWVSEGEDFPLNVIAVGLDGVPVRPPAPVELTVESVTKGKVLYEADGDTRQVARYAFNPVLRKVVEVREPELLGNRWTLRTSKASELLRLKEGRYTLTVRTTDSKGHPVETRTTLDIGQKRTAAELAEWEKQKDSVEEELEDSVFVLMPDRDSKKRPYRVGETLKLLVTSEKPGNAVLTVEAGKVLRTQVLELRDKNTEVEVPLLAEDVPHVRLNVTRFRGLQQSLRRVKSASTDSADTTVHVIPVNSELGVGITGLPQTTRPRALLTPEVMVTCTDGTAAANAEVTLYAVDEGVLRMSGYETPEPLSGIYGGYARGLQRVSNCRSFQSEEHDPREGYYNKGYMVGGGGGDGGDVRGDFPLTVLWIAEGKTDKKGRFKTEFKAPENLSSFRVMAVVSHGASSFGAGEAVFRVQKDLQIQSGAPQLAREGDQLWLRAIVQNGTPEARMVEVTLNGGDGVNLLEGASRRLSVGAHATEPVDFKVLFSKAGSARLEWRVRAETGGGGDAMENRVMVEPATALLTESHFFKIEPGASRDLSGISDLLLRGQSRLSVKLSGFGRSQLQERARMLLHYPYGCAEQTVSSTIPWLLAGGLNASDVSPSNTQRMVARGLARLETMQTDSGGISYWPQTSKPMLFASAYAGVLVALVEEYEGGALASLVSASFRGRLVGYLKSVLRSQNGASASESTSSLCLSLYALSLLREPELGAHERFLKDAEYLADDERMLLALAMSGIKGSETAARALYERPGNRESFDDFGSLERDNALRLLACKAVGASEEPVQKIVGELIAASSRKDGSTQANAWVLLALNKILPPEPDTPEPGRGTLRIQGVRSSYSFGGGSGARNQIEMGVDWDGGKREQGIQISNDSRRTVYALVSIAKREEDSVGTGRREGYSLRRTFEKLDAQNNASPAVDLKPGDRVRVKLEVTAHQGGAYLALKCPLPANLEAIQSFATRESTASAKAARDSFSDHREIRSDGFVYFQDRLRRGSFTVEAVARVRVAGEAVAPAARIEEMYHPERFGQTSSQRLMVGR